MEGVYTWDNREWQSSRTTLTSSDVNDSKQRAQCTEGEHLSKQEVDCSGWKMTCWSMEPDHGELEQDVFCLSGV